MQRLSVQTTAKHRYTPPLGVAIAEALFAPVVLLEVCGRVFEELAGRRLFGAGELPL